MKEETKNFAQSKISRRKFIEGAAASAFTFTVMKPALAFGTEANSKIQAGIIGLGWRGSWLTDLVVNHGGFKIAAVADYFDEVVQAAGDRFGVPKEKRFSGLSGYKKLIESGVDAVFHETPPYCFPEHIKASVDAGKHIYLAKPLGCDVPGCLSIAQSAKKAKENKKVFLVDFQTRTDPFYIEGIKRVQNGEIGKPVLLNSIYTDEGFEDPPKTKTIESRLRFLRWVNDNDLGGGYLVNAGIHAVDVALWIAGGQPVSAVGSSSIGAEKPNGDSHRIFSLTYQFANGLILNHWGEHLKNRMEFTSQCFAYCQDGYLETQ
jgi:myo-inositol 2-dehydrogenase/D-chiro-inositol 1-dehydrogenase